MTTVRGYGWGEGKPRHTVKKRTYRDCTGCGKRTWSPRGVCATCSGRAEYRRDVIINGYTKAAASKKRASQIYHLLHTTNKTQVTIADETGVTTNLVSQIRTGNAHIDITGGYVVRPYERES